MFGLGRSAEDKALIAFNKTDFGKGLTSHLREYFGEGGFLGKYSAEAKTTITLEFYERIFDIVNSENAFEKMRVALADEMYYVSQFMVLLPDRRREPNSRYLSNELNAQIAKCAGHNSEIAEELWKRPNCSASELSDFVTLRIIRSSIFLNGFKLVRAELRDAPSVKDWFIPFAISTEIAAEDLYRSKIGLPSLLNDTFMLGVSHRLFYNLVRNGHRNPLYEWEKAHGDHSVAAGIA